MATSSFFSRICFALSLEPLPPIATTQELRGVGKIFNLLETNGSVRFQSFSVATTYVTGMKKCAMQRPGVCLKKNNQEMST